MTGRPELNRRRFFELAGLTSLGGVPSAFAISRTLSCFSATSTCGAAVAPVQPSSSRARFSGGSSGTPWSASSFAANSRCWSGIIARSWASSLLGSISPMPSYFCGITRSTP